MQTEVRRVVLLFVTVACGLLLVQAGQVVSSDGASMLAVSRSIVDDQDLTVPPGDGVAAGGTARTSASTGSASRSWPRYPSPW